MPEHALEDLVIEGPEITHRASLAARGLFLTTLLVECTSPPCVYTTWPPIIDTAMATQTVTRERPNGAATNGGKAPNVKAEASAYSGSA